MKKLLQFVALVLMLSVSAQSALTENACGQRACGNHRTMDCCSHANGTAMAATMPMGMGCGEVGLVATAPRFCAEDTCCTPSGAGVPTIFAPNASATAIQGGSITFAKWLTPPAPVAWKRTPRPGATLPTARYILFRDFRI